MAGRSSRSIGLAAGAGILTLGTAAAALADRTDLALVGLGGLTGACALLLISVLERVGNLSRAVRLGGESRTVADAAPALPTASPGAVGRAEVAERRIIAIFETERLRAADRHDELLSALGVAPADFRSARTGSHDDPALSTATAEQLSAAVEEIVSASRAAVKRAVTDLTAVGRDETRAVEALLQLTSGASFRAPLPPSGRWAMDARGILELIALLRADAPRTVVELGGGTSTIWMAYALEQSGGKIVTVDHDPHFAEVTRWNVARHSLDGIVEVRVAPLAPWDGEGTAPWYSKDALDGLEDIDLLVVDGPPASIADDARFPALPSLRNKLADGALVVLDDADRPAEKEAIQHWLDLYPELSRVVGDYGRLAVLRWTKG